MLNFCVFAGDAVSPIKAMNSLAVKKAPTSVTMINLTVCGEDEPDYTAATLMSGDLFHVHGQIQLCNAAEAEVNGRMIAPVRHAKKAKFISKRFAKVLIKSIPASSKALADFLDSNFEVSALYLHTMTAHMYCAMFFEAFAAEG